MFLRSLCILVLYLFFVSSGLPPIVQEIFVALDEEKEKELSLPLRDDLAQLLGRPGIPLKQYITEFVADLKANKF